MQRIYGVKKKSKKVQNLRKVLLMCSNNMAHNMDVLIAALFLYVVFSIRNLHCEEWIFRLIFTIKW